MKKYLYAIPFIALIDPLISFGLASWVFSQNFDLLKTVAFFFCLFSFIIALVLISFAMWLMANKPIKNAKVTKKLFLSLGLVYFALGIYSLIVQPIAISPDFYTQLGAHDNDFFVRLLESSSIEIWSVALSALFMLLLLAMKKDTSIDELTPK